MVAETNAWNAQLGKKKKETEKDAILYPKLKGFPMTQLLRRAVSQVSRAYRSRLQTAATANAVLSCTTFNIHAPIYRRLGHDEESRESGSRDLWLSRNQKILDLLLQKNSSVVCLQEFWLANDELVQLYDRRLGDAGYKRYKLARTNDRGDGLLTAVKKDALRVLDCRELHFHDCGDRVAQVLHLKSNDKIGPREQQQVVLVNTHLIFPHASNYSLLRLRQAYKILKFVEHFKDERSLSHAPVLLCGDWNGSKRGQVYRFLRSQGFVSSYDMAREYWDIDADAHRWVSHRNHHGNVCGVDFIWLLNPTRQQPIPLRESWKRAVFGIIKLSFSASFVYFGSLFYLTWDRFSPFQSTLLREHGKQGRDAFGFFLQGKEHVTDQDFHAAIKRLELSKDELAEEDLEGLSREEVEELIVAADLDANGVIDYKDFQERLLNHEKKSWLTRLFQGLHETKSLAGADLQVQHASFYPPQVEEGTWPESYSLSDHAPLTASFCPRQPGMLAL
ncbi:uncharacterized calcium-binding protein At1g02270 [Selaginella moellendorffii]|uniref:uncharacterized calcium-binding protein At1g02270 n=1 Tax=Selaginella moellendorffii TaxID=88036 RepID=UPI000D1CB868|nr:uncharacterized calcium-binding protein At1g02270 [Selaginella moellendorffii]|eukprot:XP_024532103.1 uncharacterized calcium-binding protein At1g02270 [Selaginella moellendorffii]